MQRVAARLKASRVLLKRISRVNYKRYPKSIAAATIQEMGQWYTERPQPR